MDAPVLYLVRCWVNPDGGQKVIDWLDNGHVAEVVAQPGFLWSRRVKLEETDDQGWQAYMMIYGMESRAAIDAYMDNPIREKFAEEGKALQGLMRVERSIGAVDLVVDGASARAAE